VPTGDPFKQLIVRVEWERRADAPEESWIRRVLAAEVTQGAAPPGGAIEKPFTGFDPLALEPFKSIQGFDTQGCCQGFRSEPEKMRDRGPRPFLSLPSPQDKIISLH